MRIKTLSSVLRLLFFLAFGVFSNAAEAAYFPFATAGNIGIGTTTPNAKLHIGGGGTISNIMPITGDDLYVKGNIELDGRIYGDGSSLTGVTGAISGLTATRVPVASGSTTVIDSGIYYVGNNAGIGTATPLARLEVRDVAAVQGTSFDYRFTIDPNNGSGPQLQLGNSSDPSDYFRIGAWGGENNFDTKSRDFRLYSDSVAAGLYMNDATGNIGLGTAVPLARLEMVGAGTTAATSPLIVRDPTGSIKFRLLGDGNVGIGTYSPRDALHVYGAQPSIILEDTGTSAGVSIQFRNYYSGSVYTGSIRNSWLSHGMVFTSPRDINQGGFRFENALGTDLFVINTSSGNVGIGTVFVSNVVPGSKLSVLGNASIGYNYALLSATANGMVVEGNVGIGTSNPVSSLEIRKTGLVSGVNSFLRLTGNSPNADDAMAIEWFYENENEVMARISSERGAVGDTPLLRFQTGNGFGTVSTRMVIDRGGNVGIGTTLPGYLLTVAPPANAYADIAMYSTGGVGARILFGDSGAVNGALTYNDQVGGALELRTGGIGATSTRMTINSAGNVGIGTYVPLATLDLVGTGTTSATSALTIRDSTRTIKSAFLNNGNLGIGTSTPSATLEIQRLAGVAPFMVSSVNMDGDYLVVDPLGNVGVGDATPSTKFEVNGSAIIKGTSTSGIEGELVYDDAANYYKYYDGTSWQQIAGGSISYSGTLWNQVGNYIYYNAGYVGIGTTYPDNQLTLFQMADSDGLKINGFDDQRSSYAQIHITSAGDMRIRSNAEMIFDIAGTNAIANSSNFTHYRTTRLNDNIVLTTGIDQDYSLGYNSADDTFRIADGSNLTSTPRITLNSSGCVGIGSTSPRTTLDVIGGIIGNSSVSSDALYAWTLVQIEGGAGEALYLGDNPSWLIGTSDATYTANADGGLHLRDTVNALTRLYIDTAGNVGIATVVPLARLDVSSTLEKSIISRVVGTDNHMHLTTTSSGEVYTQVSNATTAGNAWMYGMDDDESFRIAYGAQNEITDSNARIYLSQAGNLGIGTLAPIEKLEVVGDLLITGGSVNFNSWGGVPNRPFFSGDGNGTFIYSVDNDAADGIHFLATGGTTDMMFIGGGSSYLANVGIGTSQPVARLQISNAGTVPNAMSSTGSDLFVKGNIEFDGRIYGDGSSLTGVTGAISGLTATRVPVASTSTTVVDSMIYSVGNNVGIGTAAPAYDLDIGAFAATGKTLRLAANDNTTASIRLMEYDDNYGFSLQYDGSPNTFSILRHDASQTGTEALSILRSSGNVGIGTPDPKYSLEVRSPTNSTASFYGSSGTAVVRIGVNGNLVSQASQYRIYGSSGIPLMLGGGNSYSHFVITPAGNIGIGTTAPESGLDIETGSIKINNGITGAGSSGTIYLGDGSFTKTYGGQWTYTGGVDVYGGSRVMDNNLLAYGNVGIGTSVGPVARLDLVGAGTTSATSAIIIRNSSRTAKMTVLDDGNVGIGTMGPTSKLDVNDSMIRVRTSMTPASADAACNQGEIAWDSSYVYVCVTTNTWKRTAISTW